MTDLNVQLMDRAVVRQIIIDMKGGVLDDKDALALAACTSNASHTWVCTIDGLAVAVWGLVPPTILADRAYLWLFATAGVDAHKFMFVRRSQVVLEQMKRLYPHIYGVCSIDDRRAIRWIKWLGGQFSQPGSLPGLVPFEITTQQSEALCG